MRHALVSTLVLLFTGLFNPACPQQHIFKNYTVNDGLIANSVRRIFQDSKGFLWIATWEGLSKYDGHKFTNYSTANGLSENMVNDIYESAEGRLYIATNIGMVDIINEKEVIEKGALHGVIINKFHQTADKKIIAISDKTGIYELSNGKLMKPKQAFPEGNYLDIAELNDSLFAMQTDKSLHILNRKYELFADQHQNGPDVLVSKIYKDSKKRVWVASQEGLKIVSPLQIKNQPVSLAEPPSEFNFSFLKKTWIKEIFEDAGNNIWIGTFTGLLKIDPAGHQQWFTEKNGLPSGDISCIYQDREMNIWIGTALGLAKLVTKTNINVYTTENGLSSNQLSFVLPTTEGNMIASSLKGLHIFDKDLSRILPSLPPQTYYSWYVVNSQPLLVIDQNKIVEFDASTRSISHTLSFDMKLPLIYCAASDNKGTLFVSSGTRLFICTGNKVQEDSTIPYRTHALLVDNKGNLWIGTWDKGLYCLQYSFKDNKIILSVKNHYLPGKNIRCLYEDARGNIWVGTRYNGVYKLNAASGYSIQNFDQNNGLTSNWIRAIAEGEHGSMWIGFYLGLDKLVASDTTFRIFNFSRVNNFFANINSIAMGSDRSLWLATTQGLIHIRDGEMEKGPALPVYITSVSLADTVFRFNSGNASVSKELKYKDNQVQFEFSSPGFINEKQVFYSYRLLGSNTTSWSKPSNQHVVLYASLQPGEYQFEVRTLGWNGNWGDVSAFEFTIAPPFWRTWWFITLCAFVLVSGIYWVMRKRIGIIRHEAEMKNKIAETEMMALRAQMNPHFIFNCLSAIDNLVQTNQPDKATTYLARFAKLIRAVLDSSKNNVVLFQKDFETLRLYLEMEQFRSNDKFTYLLNADPELLNSDYKVPPLIVQPFLENAIQHGLLNKQSGDRHINVMVKLQEEYIVYTIIDNGIGRKQAAVIKEMNRPEHMSYGLQIITERVHLHNRNNKAEDIKITDLQENGIASGTKVEVRIKINEA